MHQVELLSPAGCFSSLSSALNAGADAVYFGVAHLNMRARARHVFQLTDLDGIASRCHDAGAKAFLCLNTVLFDDELDLCRTILDTAQKASVNAVIVSDMAALVEARERDIEAHLSTQMSISNFVSLSFYAQYCDRVILARELALPQIKAIYQQIVSTGLRGPNKRLMEIEVFGHGAMCIAVSGRCGMSLYTHNASANRGRCIQDCRREYIVKDAVTGQELAIDNHHVMSPTDLQTLTFLDQVVDSGISCLKIEGRARSPEYVATVTRTYRSALDAIANGVFNEALVDSFKEDLQRVFNRGLSSGYYLGHAQTWASTSRSRATRRKVQVGTITNYYARIGVAEFKMNTGASLQVGDEYLVVGPTSGVVDGRVDELRFDGAVYTIPVAQPVRRGDRIYRMDVVQGI
ncbi:MAG: U32 family peptidase [Proteobacteria bacterium]|jgi:U32 family peptidase|nr:U32 family peptidase [Pseudomonadota bacterium]